VVYQHAPSTFFGLSLLQVMDTQFIEQVKRVLVHGAVPSHTSRYFNISLEQAQLKVGIGTPLLEASYNDFGFLLTYCWVKLMWEFLWMHKVHLRNLDQILPKLESQGDFFHYGSHCGISRLFGERHDTNQSLLLGLQSNDDCQGAHRGRYQGYSECYQAEKAVTPVQHMGLAQ
jgi:hypothetical protein